MAEKRHYSSNNGQVGAFMWGPEENEALDLVADIITEVIGMAFACND